MDGPVELVLLDRADVPAALPRWVGLYNRCFTDPPWSEPLRSVQQYLEKTAWHHEQEQLRVVEARGAQGALLGVAYGWPAAPAPPDLPFYRALAAGLGERSAERLWRGRPFEVVELMVEPTARGHGLGRRLLGRLCTDAAWCWLATHVDAPAGGLYRHLGWTRCGSFTSPAAGGDVELEVLVLDRSPELDRSA